MDYIKIDGCDYNAKYIASVSFQQFRIDGKHSFCKGKTEPELRDLYKLICKAHATGPADKSI